MEGGGGREERFVICCYYFFLSRLLFSVSYFVFVFVVLFVYLCVYVLFCFCLLLLLFCCLESFVLGRFTFFYSANINRLASGIQPSQALEMKFCVEDNST